MTYRLLLAAVATAMAAPLSPRRMKATLSCTITTPITTARSRAPNSMPAAPPATRRPTPTATAGCPKANMSRNIAPAWKGACRVRSHSGKEGGGTPAPDPPDLYPLRRARQGQGRQDDQGGIRRLRRPRLLGTGCRRGRHDHRGRRQDHCRAPGSRPPEGRAELIALAWSLFRTGSRSASLRGAPDLSRETRRSRAFRTGPWIAFPVFAGRARW